MNCSCPIWKYKELKTICACGGVVYYQKINKIDETQEKKKILNKLKEEIAQLRTDITIKKMELRELENEIISDDGDDEIAEAVKDFLVS